MSAIAHERIQNRSRDILILGGIATAVAALAIMYELNQDVQEQSGTLDALITPEDRARDYISEYEAETGKSGGRLDYDHGICRATGGPHAGWPKRFSSGFYCLACGDDLPGTTAGF